MLKFSLAFVRRAALNSALRNAKAFSSAPYVAASAAERASHILSLSKPLKDDEPSLLHQQKQFLQELGSHPPHEDIDLAFKVYDKVLDLSRGVDKFSCARLSLLCLNGGMPDRALEPWARLLEALGSRAASTRALERILDLPEFEPAAMAALAAYFVVAGPAADPETAHKLVPRQHVPSNLSILRNLGGIQSHDAEKIALRGLASLRKHVTKGFTDPSFIDQIAVAPYAETNKLWNQVEMACKPNEIPEVCYAAFIRRFAETRQSQRAFDLWQQLVKSGVPITTTSWIALLRAASCAPKNSELLFFNFWDKMVANGFTPDAACFAERLLCVARHRDIEEALKEFRNAQKSQPELVEIRGINAIVSALAKAQRFEEADEVLKWGIEHNIEPNTYTYNALISAAARKPEVSSGYLQQMIERGIPPSIVTYTFAMQQMLKRGQPIGELLTEMQEAKIEPNERFNTTLAYYLGRKTQDLSAARQTIQTILDKHMRLNIETLGAFIELELRHGDVNRAVQYTNLMHKFGLTPNLPTYNQLIRGAIRRGRLDVARSTFDRMVDGNVQRLKPNAYTYKFLLQPWSFADLQSNEAVRSLIKAVVPHMLQQPEVIEYALAKRIEDIANATGKDLIPTPLSELASQRALERYNRRLATKA